jgi:hypothetical protein
MQSFSQIIDLFGGPADFARAVGMTPGAAKQAKRRDSINASISNTVSLLGVKNGVYLLSLQLVQGIQTSIEESRR